MSPTLLSARTSRGESPTITAVIDVLLYRWPDTETVHERLAEYEGEPVRVIICTEDERGARSLETFCVIASPQAVLPWAFDPPAELPLGADENGIDLGENLLIDVFRALPDRQEDLARARSRVQEMVSALPVLSPLRPAHLRELPSLKSQHEASADDVVREVVMLTYFHTSVHPGTMWFLSHFDPTTGEVQGFFRPPSGSGLKSKFGSVHLDDLLESDAVARVRLPEFESGPLTLGTVAHWCSEQYRHDEDVWEYLHG